MSDETVHWPLLGLLDESRRFWWMCQQTPRPGDLYSTVGSEITCQQCIEEFSGEIALGPLGRVGP